jgi:hypothetical protein
VRGVVLGGDIYSFEWRRSVRRLSLRVRSAAGPNELRETLAGSLPRILEALLDLRRPECHTRNTRRDAGISRIGEATTSAAS